MTALDLDRLPATSGSIAPERDGRYRLYTADVLPFDAVPAYPAGPALVAHTTWGVSTSTGDGIDGAQLNVHRFASGAAGPGERHELDGHLYRTYRDAQHAAYDAGVLAFMIYHKDAPRWGLPA